MDSYQVSDRQDCRALLRGLVTAEAKRKGSRRLGSCCWLMRRRLTKSSGRTASALRVTGRVVRTHGQAVRVLPLAIG